MPEVEQLSQLIGDVYDAALDPGLWPSALEEVYRFVGGSAVGLYVRDPTLRTGNVHYHVGGNPRCVQLYFEKYIKLDPVSAAYLVLEVGEVTSNSLLLPQAEFIETRFYKEWVKPQGWIDNISVILERSATSAAMLSILRHERDGLVDDEARQRMRLVVPHLRRAVLIEGCGLGGLEIDNLAGGRQVVKSLSNSHILAAVAGASLAGMALVAPIQEAQAGKGGGTKAAAGARFSTGVPNKAAGRLYCVGSGCPRSAGENKATTTGTNKANASGPEVRDHRGGSQGGALPCLRGVNASGRYQHHAACYSLRAMDEII